MSKNSILGQKLREILTSQKYSDLMPYQDPKLWRTMTLDERELLGKLFVLHGKDKLKKGDNLILAAFGGGFTWGSIYLKWAYNKQ